LLFPMLGRRLGCFCSFEQFFQIVCHAMEYMRIAIDFHCEFVELSLARMSEATSENTKCTKNRGCRSLIRATPALLIRSILAKLF
jgi:hypothetical protein